MKKLILILALVMSSTAFADDCVQGYYRKDGTYVDGYCRTTRDNTVDNNYGTYGNQNPYNGNYGTKPDSGGNSGSWRKNYR